MGIRSMTGQGSATVRDKLARVTVTASSVNRRHLDIAFSMPDIGVGWEPLIQRLVSKYVSRGRVAGRIEIEWLSRQESFVRLDQNLAAAYVAAMRRLGAQVGLRDDLTLTSLLYLRDLIRGQMLASIGERLWPLVEAAMKKALEKLVKAREKEGQHLQKDLEKRLSRVAAHLESIKRRAPQVVKKYRAQLLQRLQEAGLRTSGDDERLQKELMLFADRCDVSEEIVRLEGHIEHFRSCLQTEESPGRKLDFLVQEMLREAHTIGSKSNDLVLSRQVVEIKTELERIREQVQNIE